MRAPAFLACSSLQTRALPLDCGLAHNTTDLVRLRLGAPRRSLRRRSRTRAMPPQRPMRASAGAPARVDVGALLGAATDAASRAVRVIRRVQEAREGGATIGEEYKDVSDPRSALTIADKRAQAVIVEGLTRAFPGIVIVAEEDEDDAFDLGDDALFGIDGCDAPLSLVCEGLETPEELRDVAMEDVCVFIDPVDATLAFVQAKTLDAVQTLIGISYKGRAVAGAIGLPFHEGTPVVSSLVGAGVAGLPAQTRKSEDIPAVGATLTSSANPKDPVVIAAEAIVGQAVRVPRSGAGNKMLAVARGDAEVTVLNRISSLWDTCAPEAMVTALGGTVTDLCGNRIRHAADARIGNIYGVIATSARFQTADSKGRTHAEMCREMRLAGVANSALADSPVCLVATTAGEPQATDVARDVDGNPLTAAWLSSVVGAEVESYSAPEASAHRYLMSDAVRLVLHRAEASASSVPESLFYKRVVLEELEHIKLKARTAPAKIERDVTSYQVEASFLASRACARLCEVGANIPRVYDAVSRPACLGQSPVESRFALLLEDYSSSRGWSQKGILEGGELRAALASLANMHAFFWSFTKDQDYSELQEAVWDRATYWTPERQAANLVELVVPEWEKHRANFNETLVAAGVTGSADGKITLDNLGAKLSSVAQAVAQRVHSVGSNETHPHRTVIHGDSKAANFFFRAPTPGVASADPDIGIIDFQWTGFGHPLVDVAYTIASSAAMSELSLDGAAEAAHVEYYVGRLAAALVKHGKAETEVAASALLPLADALDFYDDCIIDLAKLVFSYHWARINASPAVLTSRADMLGSNSYNKSVPHAVWLVARTIALLTKRTA
jgi:3'-phosphoadenosine 5'-phosphosulfate (PAPS) 3'-phosphatase